MVSDVPTSETWRRGRSCTGAPRTSCVKFRSSCRRHSARTRSVSAPWRQHTRRSSTSTSRTCMCCSRGWRMSGMQLEVEEMRTPEWTILTNKLLNWRPFLVVSYLVFKRTLVWLYFCLVFEWHDCAAISRDVTTGYQSENVKVYEEMKGLKEHHKDEITRLFLENKDLASSNVALKQLLEQKEVKHT